MDLSSLELHRLQEVRGGRDLLVALFLHRRSVGKVQISVEVTEVKGMLKGTPACFSDATAYLSVFWCTSKYELMLLRRMLDWMNLDSSTGIVWSIGRQAIRLRTALWPGLIDDNGVLV